MNVRTASDPGTRVRRSAPWTGIVAACVVAGALGAAPAGASPVRNGLVEARAVAALAVRSAALNHRYHLDRPNARWALAMCPCSAGLWRRPVDPVSATVPCPCNAGLPVEQLPHQRR
jgi:hypothetical protein